MTDTQLAASTSAPLYGYLSEEYWPLSAMKLQKLVYYAQAWSLVWEDRPLFRARIEAWANGPVTPELCRHHRGTFQVAAWPLGNPGNLAKEERTTVDAIVKFYGDRSPQWLSDLTHMETPWIEARRGLGPSEAGTNEITLASMAEYYGSL
ncbi:MAG TPA: type II toxin-antitoxin system antitoxin SocA domain-containing protein [Acidobacteriaceae bacterium]|nr:type II toxin-antitoxin system antitoxin SocA domain-containing protein [Acidobacteriaceae bacterium]